MTEGVMRNQGRINSAVRACFADVYARVDELARTATADPEQAVCVLLDVHVEVMAEHMASTDLVCAKPNAARAVISRSIPQGTA
jgi:hypothetical protein